MPQCSHLTELVIRQHHDKLGHTGTNHTWASLRQRFWIVKGAAAVRHSIGQCIKCKRRNASVGKQFLANSFWQHWAKEFLPNLLQQQKWFNHERNFEVGDVVLLVEDMQHRSNWVVGRVIRTLTDKEGLVQVV